MTELIVLWFCGLPLFIFVGVISYYGYRYSQEAKRKATLAWDKLAQDHRLKFKPASGFMGNMAVTGSYRQHTLNLTTTQEDKALHTRISISIHRRRNTLSRRKNKPPAQTVSIEALDQLAAKAPGSVTGKFRLALSDPEQVYYQERGFLDDPEYLQDLLNWLVDLAELYPAIVTLGGEAVPTLAAMAEDNKHKLSYIAVGLLQDIGEDTGERLSHRLFYSFCPRCMATCGPHQVRLSWLYAITYYGCRLCGQSKDLLILKREVIAVLDEAMTDPLSERQRVLRVNWLTRQALFDFGEVEIIQATDEAVERFAIQVSNDTDPIRQPHYEQMRCIVSAQCDLTENTMRILRRTFGQVEVSE